MNKPMILYRGSLKSCNYHCTYCPFARHPMGKRELETDRLQWERFVQTFWEMADSCFGRDASAHVSGPCQVPDSASKWLQAPDHISEIPETQTYALMVVPYGEALIHPWYWEGLGRLGARPRMDAVGAQTNLSFPIESSLDLYQKAGGDLAKLRLWATFHPEMTTAETFAHACQRLRAADVTLCAGAVGKPENLEQIRRLRQALPAEVYLWINQMDGMGRDYTQEEMDAFLEIDPYFLRELVLVPADPARCQGRIFVEGNGRMGLCNISQALPGGHPAGKGCSRKFCSCYLAYGGRSDFMNQILFGPDPLFRIPRRPRAVFLDIMGTLLPHGTEKHRSPESSSPAQGPLPEDPSGIPALTLAGLEALKRERIPAFFATTLPYEEAISRCRSVRHLFSGGIFSGGAHIRLEQEDRTREYFYYLPETFPEHMGKLEAMKKRFRYRILACRNEDKLYRITLLRPRHLPWREPEARELAEILALDDLVSVRYFMEDCCLQILSSEADKGQGVRILCQWLGIPPEETAAAGDSREDEEMRRAGVWFCGA